MLAISNRALAIFMFVSGLVDASVMGDYDKAAYFTAFSCYVLIASKL